MSRRTDVPSDVNETKTNPSRAFEVRIGEEREYSEARTVNQETHAEYLTQISRGKNKDEFLR